MIRKLSSSDDSETCKELAVSEGGSEAACMVAVGSRTGGQWYKDCHLMSDSPLEELEVDVVPCKDGFMTVAGKYLGGIVILSRTPSDQRQMLVSVGKGSVEETVCSRAGYWRRVAEGRESHPGEMDAANSVLYDTLK